MELGDLKWLAGLLEGEGCFTYCGSSPMVQLQMTDHDVVLRAAQLMGGTVGRRKRETTGGKIAWFTQLSGSRAAAMMMTLHALMGERRKSQIRTRLMRWRAAPIASQKRRECKNGHPLVPLPETRRFDGHHRRYCPPCSRARWRETARKARAAQWN